jgi:hypothetical protein
MIIFQLYGTGVVDTDGKFAAGIVDTGGNLLPLSLISVDQLYLRISPRIFGKIRDGSNVIIGGFGEDDS